MAWRQTDDKPFYEPMMAYFTDAYMRHSASMFYHNMTNFLPNTHSTNARQYMYHSALIC